MAARNARMPTSQDALSNASETREYDENDDGLLDGHRVQQAIHALVQRDARTQGEDQQRDHEAPEIELAAIAQGVHSVGRPGGARDPVEQQQLVDRVDQGMHRLAQHGGRARDGGGHELRGGDQQVAGQRRPDSRIGAGFRHVVFATPNAAQEAELS